MTLFSHTNLNDVCESGCGYLCAISTVSDDGKMRLSQNTNYKMLSRKNGRYCRKLFWLLLYVLLLIKTYTTDILYENLSLMIRPWELLICVNYLISDNNQAQMQADLYSEFNRNRTAICRVEVRIANAIQLVTKIYFLKSFH